MTATPTPCTITVRDIAGGGRPCYEVRHGTTVLARTHSHTQIRDALRKLAADCEAEGLVLEIDAGELAPTLVASWRAADRAARRGPDGHPRQGQKDAIIACRCADFACAKTAYGYNGFRRTAIPPPDEPRKKEDVL